MAARPSELDVLPFAWSGDAISRRDGGSQSPVQEKSPATGLPGNYKHLLCSRAPRWTRPFPPSILDCLASPHVHQGIPCPISKSLWILKGHLVDGTRSGAAQQSKRTDLEPTSVQDRVRALPSHGQPNFTSCSLSVQHRGSSTERLASFYPSCISLNQRRPIREPGRGRELIIGFDAVRNARVGLHGPLPPSVAPMTVPDSSLCASIRSTTLSGLVRQVYGARRVALGGKIPEC